MTAADLDADGLVATVAQWAAPFLRDDAPLFGTPEWLDLDLQDPRRAAAVVRAALAWWRAGEPLADMLERAEAAEDKASAIAISTALADSRQSDIYRPGGPELARARDWGQRRDQPDHPGGPVPVWGPDVQQAAG